MYKVSKATVSIHYQKVKCLSQKTKNKWKSAKSIKSSNNSLPVVLWPFHLVVLQCCYYMSCVSQRTGSIGAVCILVHVQWINNYHSDTLVTIRCSVYGWSNKCPANTVENLPYIQWLKNGLIVGYPSTTPSRIVGTSKCPAQASVPPTIPRTLKTHQKPDF